MAKKISAIVSLVLIAIVVATTIIMATIKVDHNIKYKNPDEVWVTYNGKTQQIVAEKDANKILKLMKEATTESYLTALFNKTTKEKPELVDYRNTASSIPSTSYYYVIFNYSNPQKIDDDFYYTSLIFSIDKEDGEKEVKVYISEDGTMTYKKYYLIDVDYSSIYTYLTNKGYNN